jgi:hypothetical protein
MTTIYEVIREATNEHEVYFLLTSYVEAVRHGDMLSCLPGPVRDLPFRGLDDVRTRVDGLKAELGQSLPRNTRSRVIVKESTEIFSEALNRLQSLEWERRRAAAMAA